MESRVSLLGTSKVYINCTLEGIEAEVWELLKQAGWKPTGLFKLSWKQFIDSETIKSALQLTGTSMDKLRAKYEKEELKDDIKIEPKPEEQQ